MLTAAELISMLNLQPHPEGGHYSETFRDPREVDGRALASGGYFLLAQGERPDWRHLDAAELWQFYEGAPLELEIADDGGKRSVTLGPDTGAGQRPQAACPTGAWQMARTLGDWTLISWTAGPGLDFSGFDTGAETGPESGPEPGAEPAPEPSEPDVA